VLSQPDRVGLLSFKIEPRSLPAKRVGRGLANDDRREELPAFGNEEVSTLVVGA
jgi:hypothetical protein